MEDTGSLPSFEGGGVMKVFSKIKNIPKELKELKWRSLEGVLCLSALYGLGTLWAGSLIIHYWKVQPCFLCYSQRLILMAATLGAFIAWQLLKKFPQKKFYLLIPLLYTLNLGVAFYHSGVERHVFPAPSQCGGDALVYDGDADKLRALLIEKETIPCDKISWSLGGLSMANYNALCSLIVLGLWGYVLTRKRRDEKGKKA